MLGGNDVKGQKLIDPDIEEPAVSRRTVRSSLSFACSLVAHLVLLLFLTLFWFAAEGSDLISLDAATTPNELSEEVMFSAITVETSSEMLEVDSEMLEEGLTELALSESTDISVDQLPQSEGLFDDLELTPVPSVAGGFFGLEAKGNKIIYIIDVSPSMSVGYPQSRFRRAVDEVKKSIASLRPDQQFFVFLFSFKTQSMRIAGKHQFCSPTAENQMALEQWLDSRMLLPGTDPREAIVEALQMKPTCCFLLSDGEFNGRNVQNGPFGGGRSATAEKLAKKHNRSKCPIHTIGLEDRQNQKVLSTIARQSKGTYKFIPAVE